MYTVLIADDDPSLCRNIALALETAGYRTISAATAAEAVAEAPSADLILLDVMLPDDDGFSCCRQIRSLTDVPLLFLTSCAEEQEIVQGLDAGADDYITKPFRLRELMSRIAANLRRTDAKKADMPDLDLTAAEQKLLHYLMQNAGHYVTREQILAALWDSGGSYVNDNTLSVHISRLRDKLQAAQFGQIRTKRGLGYQWTEQSE